MKIVIILVLKVLKITLNMFLLVCVFSLQHGRVTLTSEREEINFTSQIKENMHRYKHLNRTDIDIELTRSPHIFKRV